MKTFRGTDGRQWTATAAEEDTPRHHGRWYMVLRAAEGGEALMLPEVRWQTRETAERTIRTMSEFELLRRLRMAAGRHDVPGATRDPFGDWKAGGPGAKGGAEGP